MDKFIYYDNRILKILRKVYRPNKVDNRRRFCSQRKKALSLMVVKIILRQPL